MKILFVSGFLGAGKTRFIQHMSQKTGRKFVIVENEFADINIDSERLGTSQGEASAGASSQESTSDVVSSEAVAELEALPDVQGVRVPDDPQSPFKSIVELSEGCICCSLNLDFNHSILTIANVLDPDYVVVEPSGVAKLSNIVNKLQSICYERIGLLAPVVIVDAKHYKSSRSEFPETFKDQLSYAGSVIISHSESLSEAEFEAIKADIDVPKDALCPLTHYDSWDIEQWNYFLETEFDEEYLEYLKRKTSFAPKSYLNARFKRHVQKRADKALTSISMTDIHLANPAQLFWALDMLTTRLAGHVVRAKGSICFEGSNQAPIKFDLVEESWSAIGDEAATQSQAVVIGEGINKALIKSLFQADHTTTEAVQE